METGTLLTGFGDEQVEVEWSTKQNKVVQNTSSVKPQVAE